MEDTTQKIEWLTRAGEVYEAKIVVKRYHVAILGAPDERGYPRLGFSRLA